MVTYPKGWSPHKQEEHCRWFHSLADKEVAVYLPVQKYQPPAIHSELSMDINR